MICINVVLEPYCSLFKMLTVIKSNAFGWLCHWPRAVLVKIAAWVVSGSTSYELSPGINFDAQAKKRLAVRDALQDAGAKFIIEFRNQPDVRRWLNRQDTPPSAAEPKGQT